MKFLCDRCKTRYSIGDDRVRGKILKIRCKNCANVITVREGMPDAESMQADGPRRTRTTTQAPIEASAVAANGRGANALGAAFASAMTKPPPALEEEWYVSIDGDQAGPFTLAEAQRWVANKAHDAELHCWSEGFDDWLPVDKVSHFRGLRKKPPPPVAPPPLPRVGGGTGAARSLAGDRAMARGAPVEEDEPKPLFAATMASLERGAATPAAAPVMPASAPAKRPSATPPKGQPSLQAHAHVNGSPAKAPLSPTGPVATKPMPTLAKAAGLRTATAPGVAVKAPAFDQSELNEQTQLESVPFEDEKETRAEPVASRKQTAVGAERAFADTLAAPAAPATLPNAPAGLDSLARNRAPSEDELDIGEVSRVVKLADLMRPEPKPRRSGPIASPNAASNAMIGRASGSVPKIVGGTVPVPLQDAVDVVPGANGLVSPIAEIPHELSTPAVVHDHRRGLIALLIGATLLVGATVVVLVIMLSGNREETTLGGKYELDPTRPDEIKPHGNDLATNVPEPPINPINPKWRPPPQKIIKPPVVDPPQVPSNALKADEIEAMAGKFSGTTANCFRRADKGADAILLLDVKKITVTLDVAPEGAVTNVVLSNNGSDKLGKCLIGLVKSWKFRASAGGTYRFVLAKPD